MRTFALEKKNGVDTVVCKIEGKEDDDWCSVDDLDRLFEACSKRWSRYGWDLNKLIAAINECDFD